MSVLFHLMIPRPPTPSVDAVVQEAEALREQAGGEIVYLNPSRQPGSRYPERLYGLHRLLYLRQRETEAQLHHVFNPHLFAFPYLRWLRRPILYTVTAGLEPRSARIVPTKLSGFAAVVVSNHRDRDALQRLGLANVHVIRPGIDTSRFKPYPPPSEPGFTLLMGSAPWTEAQFQSKGIDALLAAAQTRVDLRLVFLWRGFGHSLMMERVARHDLQSRVQVINRRVDVHRVLSRVHAAVVLATDSTQVKAFPHSLLEALAAGRPVLVSRTLPMSAYVAQTGCGVVVEKVSPEGVVEALAVLEEDYELFREEALRVGQRDFDQRTTVSAYQRLYEEIGTATKTD